MLSPLTIIGNTVALKHLSYFSVGSIPVFRGNLKIDLTCIYSTSRSKLLH